MAGKDFQVDDLVWAKMKGFCHWPARIQMPPTEASARKNQYYVRFFGTYNHAWTPVQNIVAHSDAQVAMFKNKKTPGLKVAIEEIVKESSAIPSAETCQVSEVKVPEIKTGDAVISDDSSDQCNLLSNVKPIKYKRKRISKPKSETKIKPMPLIEIKKEEVKPKISRRKREVIPSKRIKRERSPSPVFFPSNLDNSASPVDVIKPCDDSHATSRKVPPTVRRSGFNSSFAKVKTRDETGELRRMAATTKRIGFLGLGNMGSRILKNFICTGHKCVIWNRTLEKCKNYTNLGAVIALTPAEVVRSCDIIFSCVTDSVAVEDIANMEDGVLEGLATCHLEKKGYVEFSTITPSTARKMYELMAGRNCYYLEAPLSGTRRLAEEGSLLIVSSGDCKLFNECESCFHAISHKAMFLGNDVGSASQMNIISGMLMGATFAALGETVALLERLKLPLHIFLDILKKGPLGQLHLIEKFEAMSNRNLKTNITLKYQHQSSYLASDVSNTAEQRMHVASASISLLKHAELLHYSDQDVAAVYYGAKY